VIRSTTPSKVSPFPIGICSGAVEGLAVPDRDLQRRRPRDAVLDPVHDGTPVGVLLVHPVDHQGGGQVRGADQVPEVLGGHLEAAVGFDHEQDALDHPQGGVDIAPEVIDARGVDDVDLVAVPLGPGQAGGDGLLALDLLFRVIEHRTAVVHVAAASDLFRHMEHRIGQAGLADTVWAHQGHVADLFHGEGLHGSSSWVVDGSRCNPAARTVQRCGPVRV